MMIVEYCVDQFDAYYDGVQFLILFLSRSITDIQLRKEKAREALVRLCVADGDDVSTMNILVDLGIHIHRDKFVMKKPRMVTATTHQQTISSEQRPDYLTCADPSCLVTEQQRPAEASEALWDYMIRRDKRMRSMVYMYNAHLALQLHGTMSAERVSLINKWNAGVDLTIKSLKAGTSVDTVVEMWQLNEESMATRMKNTPITDPVARAYLESFDDHQHFTAPPSVDNTQMRFEPRAVAHERVYVSAMLSYCAVRCLLEQRSVDDIKNILLFVLTDDDLPSLSERVQAQWFNNEDVVIVPRDVDDWVLSYATARPVYNPSSPSMGDGEETDDSEGTTIAYIGGDGYGFTGNTERASPMTFLKFVADVLAVMNLRGNTSDDILTTLREDRERRHSFVKWLIHASVCGDDDNVTRQRCVTRACEVFNEENAMDEFWTSAPESAVTRAKELQHACLLCGERAECIASGECAASASTDWERARSIVPEPGRPKQIGCFCYEGHGQIHVFETPTHWQNRCQFLSVDGDGGYCDEFGEQYDKLMDAWNDVLFC